MGESGANVKAYSSLAVGLVAFHVKVAIRALILKFATSKVTNMSNAEPALPWGTQGDAEPEEAKQEAERPVDLKAGQRVRVRLQSLWLMPASCHRCY